MTSKLYGLAQTEWLWLIAIYLFLAGVAGGAYLSGVAADMMGWETLGKIGVTISWPLVGIGCLMLLLDLGQIKNAWRSAMKPGTSWMARGVIIISGFMIIGFIHTVLLWTGMGGGIVLQLLSILGCVFAFSTMVYTGLLLGDALPFPFWSTILLPVLFFVSALSTGIMAVILVGTFMGGAEEGIATLTNADIILLVLEAFVLAAYLHGAHRLPNTQPSAEFLLRGEGAAFFWGGVAFCGLAAPLCLEVAGLHGVGAAVASLFGLFGGLLLRYCVLAGGAMYGYTAAGFVFEPVNKPKDTMPGMGKVPPGNI